MCSYIILLTEYIATPVKYLMKLEYSHVSHSLGGVGYTMQYIVEYKQARCIALLGFLLPDISYLNLSTNKTRILNF